jgi:uncharacterized protein DUF2865
MRLGRKARSFVIAGSVLCVALLAPSAASAGFFDTLFGGERQQDVRAPLPYAEPTSTPSIAVTPRDSGGGTSSVAFCVRLCDGRFFPMQRHAGATPVQACSALCPAAKTKIFSGSEIAHASATDGARYADLDNAFVYRQKIVDGCTCNGRDTFGLAPVDIVNDPTLKAGDMVATEHGLQKFTGSQAQLRKGGGFTPVNLDQLPGSERRRVATGIAAAD